MWKINYHAKETGIKYSLYRDKPSGVYFVINLIGKSVCEFDSVELVQ